MDISVLPTVVVSVVLFIVVIWIVAFVVFHGTEILKGASRAVASLPALNWVAIRGYGSYVTALVLAAVAVFFPGSGLGESLANIFKAANISVDPAMVNLLTTFLISLIASAQQNSGKMPSPLKSSQTPK